jgi:hypothetical protein
MDKNEFGSLISSIKHSLLSLFNFEVKFGENGHWIRGFSKSLGSTTAYVAQLWGWFIHGEKHGI